MIVPIYRGKCRFMRCNGYNCECAKYRVVIGDIMVYDGHVCEKCKSHDYPAPSCSDFCHCEEGCYYMDSDGTCRFEAIIRSLF